MRHMEGAEDVDNNNDDGTGLRQLSNKDLVTYVIGRKKLTQIEVELVLRLEQVVEERLEVIDNLKSRLPCRTCPVLPSLLPNGVKEMRIELEGRAEWE